MTSSENHNAPTVRPVILAGGQGTRFWPISRKQRPKQFLSIKNNGESLIQLTVRRARRLADLGSQVVVTNVMHEALIKQHVPGVMIISEPIARNTAASIGLAAIKLRIAEQDPVMVVLPADHYIEAEGELVSAWSKAIDIAASENVLVTLGIEPTSPHTGYGYIWFGKGLADSAFEVRRFFEKPNYERALKYIESGSYLWNSGMFVWRASVILEAIRAHMPQLHEALQRISRVIGQPNEMQVVEKEFKSLDSISIDFGILELARNCVVVKVGACGWSDVGSWDAWAEHFDKDAQGNLKYGDALVLEGNDCVVHSQNRLIALLGVNNLVVIDAGDALLVCPRERVQDVRKIVVELEKQGRTLLI